MKVRNVALCTALALATLSSHTKANVFAYATNYRHELMKIDLTTPATFLIGNLGFTADGLAATSNGKLWATDGAGNLYNVTGGSPTLLTSLGSLSVGAMDSTGSTLWGFDNASHRLFEYNFGSNSITIWSSTIGLAAVNALAIDSNGDFLVVSAGNQFSKITNGTWNTSLINPNMNLADTCTGLDFLSDGNLYAIVFGDDRYQINPTNGTVTSGFYSGVHRDWADMTTVPQSVPEPTTMAVITLGLTCAKLRRKKG